MANLVWGGKGSAAVRVPFLFHFFQFSTKSVLHLLSFLDKKRYQKWFELQKFSCICSFVVYSGVLFSNAQNALVVCFPRLRYNNMSFSEPDETDRKLSHLWSNLRSFCNHKGVYPSNDSSVYHTLV